MQHIYSGRGTKSTQEEARQPQFVRAVAEDVGASSMLHGCPVVTGDNEVIGTIKHVIIDVETQRTRYVVLSPHGKRPSAEIVIPWEVLYFDSANAHLVFYTLL